MGFHCIHCKTSLLAKTLSASLCFAELSTTLQSNLDLDYYNAFPNLTPKCGFSHNRETASAELKKKQKEINETKKLLLKEKAYSRSLREEKREREDKRKVRWILAAIRCPGRLLIQFVRLCTQVNTRGLFRP